MITSFYTPIPHSLKAWLNLYLDGYVKENAGNNQNPVLFEYGFRACWDAVSRRTLWDFDERTACTLFDKYRVEIGEHESLEAASIYFAKIYFEKVIAPKMEILSNTYLPQDITIECLNALQIFDVPGESNTLLGLVQKAVAENKRKDRVISELQDRLDALYPSPI